MKQTLTLLWKEWREAQTYLWIGLGVFLGLPIIGALEYSMQEGHRFDLQVVGWVGCFGGALAVFAAVGATCRDLSGRIEDFWQAVPVSMWRWMSAKYLVGLSVSLVACSVPLLVESRLARQSDSDLWGFTVCFDLFVTLIFSVSFAAGCLMRRTAHAAMVGLAGMLVIYCLPLIIPPLGWMNLLDLDENFDGRIEGHHTILLGLAMLVLAAVGLVVAVTAVRRGWRIESGVKIIYGSIAAAFLILCASASFELGTDLPILQKIDLSPANHVVEYLGVKGSTVTLERFSMFDTRNKRELIAQKFHVDVSGMHLVSRLSSAVEDGDSLPSDRDLSLPDGSFINYWATVAGNHSNGPLLLTLAHFDQYGKKLSYESLPIRLWDMDGDANDSADIYFWKNRLYVIGSSRELDQQFLTNIATRLAVLDISDPLKPKLISNTAVDFHYKRISRLEPAPEADEQKLVMALPPLPGLPARQRLEFSLRSTSAALEDQTLCVEYNRGEIIAYHLVDLTDQTATFIKFAEYHPGLIERVFRDQPSGWLRLVNGLLYKGGQFRNSNVIPPTISVFDTRGPHPMQMVGHFASPGASWFVPLPDGRAIVAGESLWLVGPPPGAR
jgi:hypothetical protein